MGCSLVDSALMGVIYACCDAVAAPNGCIELHRSPNSIEVLSARILKIAWRHGKSESVPSPMKAYRRRTSPLSSCARITSAPMSFHSHADGAAVLGKARRQALPSKQRCLAGARVEGIGCTLSFSIYGRTGEVERHGRL